MTVSATPSAYGRSFFAHVDATAGRSARRVLPAVMELLAPRSVVDVGCGTGAWLREAVDLGVTDYLGVDGHVPTTALGIPTDRFLTHDLTRPLRLPRRFELVICLEVAEHLPPAAAGTLIESLALLSDAVLFSAAVPNQGGIRHLNEQWPEYWARLFEGRALVPVDAIRWKVWNDSDVAWWYRQNMLLFCREALIESRPALREARRLTRGDRLSVVHPDLYRWMIRQRDDLAVATRAGRPRTVLRRLTRAVRGAWRLGRRPTSTSRPWD